MGTKLESSSFSWKPFQLCSNGSGFVLGWSCHSSWVITRAGSFIRTSWSGDQRWWGYGWMNEQRRSWAPQPPKHTHKKRKNKNRDGRCIFFPFVALVLMLCVPIWIFLICWLKCFLIFAVDSAISVCIVLGLHDGYFWLTLFIPEFIAVISWDVEIMHSSSWSWMSLNLGGHRNYYSRGRCSVDPFW